MPRTTKAQSEATAATVLETARRRFAADGYAAVSLEDVAADAGVTRGAVYHHYGSKAGLFAAVHAAAHAEVAASVDRAADAADDPVGALRAGCHAFLRASVDDRVRRILLVDGPVAVGWATWRDHDAANSGRLLDDVLGELGVRDTPATAALLSGAMNEAALWIAGAASRAARTARQREAGRVLDVLLDAVVPVSDPRRPLGGGRTRAPAGR